MGRVTIIRRQMLTHFPTVTQSAGFQPEPLLITLCSLLKLERLRLEAYTMSNRGRSLRIADSQATDWKPVPMSSRNINIPSLRLRLEAYTMSNRGRSLRIAGLSKNSWLEASTKTYQSQCGYWLPASSREGVLNP